MCGLVDLADNDQCVDWLFTGLVDLADQCVDWLLTRFVDLVDECVYCLVGRLIVFD